MNSPAEDHIDIWLAVDENTADVPEEVEVAADKLANEHPNSDHYKTYIAHITGRRLRGEISEITFRRGARAAKHRFGIG